MEGSQILDKLGQYETVTPKATRARGAVRLACNARSGRTHLADHYQKGSLKTLFPRTPSEGLETVFLNTAGGITGGDRFSFDLQIGKNARMTATSQAAERIYKAHQNETGSISLSADVSDNGRLDWLPQETIVFDQARLRRSYDVSLAESATFLSVEPIVFGREAMGETVETAYLHDTWRVKRGDKLIFADALKIEGPVAHLLSQPTIADGNRAVASILFIAPQSEAKLRQTRELLGTTGGASLIRQDVLFARLMAPDSFLLRKTLIPILEWLSDSPIPKTWSL